MRAEDSTTIRRSNDTVYMLFYRRIDGQYMATPTQCEEEQSSAAAKVRKQSGALGAHVCAIEDG